MQTCCMYISLLVPCMHLHAVSVIFPESYTFYNGNSLTINGSSPTGNCSNSSISYHEGNRLITCLQPNSSVLFDWDVPTLAGLDGDMWASQLLTIQSINKRVDIRSTFSFNVTVERIEVLIFNCSTILSRNITLELFGGPNATRYITTKHLGSVTSCDSLVRVCISVNTSDLQEILMRFTSNNDYWLYLAEVIFYSHNSTCSPDAIINSTTLLPPDTTSPPDTTAHLQQDTSSPDTTSPVEPSVNGTTSTCPSSNHW